MRPIQFRMGSAGPGVGIGCGGIVAVLGLILISPVGAVLVRGEANPRRSTRLAKLYLTASSRSFMYVPSST